MSWVYIPVCVDCKHRYRKTDNDRVAYCTAYPNGIPQEIWEHKSIKEINEPCPNGYKFEPKDK